MRVPNAEGECSAARINVPAPKFRGRYGLCGEPLKFPSAPNSRAARVSARYRAESLP